MLRHLLSLLLLFPAFVLRAQSDADSLAFVQAQWQVEVLPRGGEVRTASFTLSGRRQTVSVVSYPARRWRTQLVEGEGKADAPLHIGRHKANRAATTGGFGRAAQARTAVNGSYFDMKRLTPITYMRVGKRTYGRTHASERFRTNGLLCLSRKGHRLDIKPTAEGQDSAMAAPWHSALAAGPLLLSEGKPVAPNEQQVKTHSDFFNGRHPRSLVGYTVTARQRPDRIVLVVVDGRFKGQAEGMSIGELTQLARWLGLHEALNLDGGGSSALWTQAQGTVSHPSDNQRFDHAGERRVPNAIVAR